MTQSPDGKWTALSDVEWCGSPFLTTVPAKVIVTSNSNPRHTARVLSVDTGGRQSERPQVDWAAADVLKVTVPSKSYLKVFTRRYQGIWIDLRFDPDDPAARTAWLKQLDMKGCLIAFMLLIGLPLVALELFFRQGGCTILEEWTALSPDGAWRAVSDVEWCESPSITSVNDNVRLVSTRNKGQKTDILGVDDNGYEIDRPRITWIAPDVLQVTVPNQSSLKVVTREYGGVRIDLRFEPDDRAARDAWLKGRKREPDPLER